MVTKKKTKNHQWKIKKIEKKGINGVATGSPFLFFDGNFFMNGSFRTTSKPTFATLFYFNMKQYKCWFLACITCVFLISCSAPKPFQYKSISNIKFQQQGISYPTISADLNYTNPNKFGVTLKHIDCKVFINKKPIGNFILDTTFIIPASSNFSLPCTIQLSYTDVFSSVINSVLTQQVTLSATGNVLIKKGIFKKKVPFYFEQQKDFTKPE